MATRAVSIDIETTGLGWGARVLTLAVAKRDDSGELVTDSINLGMPDLFNTPVPQPAARVWLQEHIRDARWLTMHNATFDLPYLLRSQLITPEEAKGRVFCTLVMARATAGHQYAGLDALVREWKIQRDRSLDGMKGQRANLAALNPELVLRYNREDARKGLLVFEHIEPQAYAQYDEEWITEEGEFSRLVSQMRVAGVPIDVPLVRQLLEDRLKELGRIKRELVLGHKIGGPFDTDGLGRKLNEDGVTVKKTPTGKPNLDEAALLEIATARPDWAPVLNQVIRGRQINKEIETWLVGFLDESDESGCIHPLMSVGGTVSSRISCKEPNAQAVKRELKDIFKVDVEADYSQAELRLGAAYAGSDKMAAVFAEGGDIHLATAIEMYGEEEGPARRPEGKTATFSGFYGGGGKAISEALGIPLEVGNQIANRWRSAYPNVRRISKAAENTWVQRGYLVLAHGKRLYATQDDKTRRPYKAFNQLVQGSVAATIQRAMMRIWRELPEVALRLQVHDDVKATLSGRLGPNERVEMGREIARIMRESAPQDILKRTTPPIEMKVDYKLREVTAT